MKFTHCVCHYDSLYNEGVAITLGLTYVWKLHYDSPSDVILVFPGCIKPTHIHSNRLTGKAGSHPRLLLSLYHSPQSTHRGNQEANPEGKAATDGIEERPEEGQEDQR